MTLIGNTESSKAALDHLRSVKPNDGWSLQIETNKNDDDGVRLLRRNAPLTDHFFLDIHHNTQSNVIVGLLTKDAQTCQMLVDGNTGRPLLQKQSDQHISCVKSYGGYKPLKDDTVVGENREGRGSIFETTNLFVTDNGPTSRPTNSRKPNDQVNPFAEWSDEDKQKYLSYGMIVLGAWIFLQVLTSIVPETLLFFLVLPGMFIYGLNTCPENSSFDAKKEVKRVLRGYHLPDDHPDKPRKGNFFEEWTAKISASLATEVGAAAGGYSVEIIPLASGVAKYATVTLPSLGLTCAWIGCNGTWYHFRTFTPQTTTTAHRARR